VILSQELSKQLKTLSQREGATLFMTLLAAFQVLLSRYTGQEDIVVGTPIANRNRDELEGLIGFLVNTLVLRTDLSGNPSFRELQTRVRKTALDAYAHQDLPFEKLVEELQPERSLSQNPLFQVMFVLHNTPGFDLTLAELEASYLDVGRNTAKFDLTLTALEEKNGIGISMDFRIDLFAPETIERMLGHYQTLLEGIAADAQKRVLDLPLLTGKERRQILVEWNSTEREYPRDKCLHELFEEQVVRSSEAVAVVCQEEQLTYQQLNARANQLAHYLRKRGVGPEVLVGICIERSLEMMIGLLGILKAGGAYVPLDPNYPEERLAWILRDTQLSMLLTKGRGIQRLWHQATEVICLDSDRIAITQEGEQDPVCQTSAAQLAYVLYTSGSTGQPKGVLIEHRSLVNYLSWVNTNLLGETNRRIPAVSSLSFDASLKQLFAPLLRGEEVWILQDDIVAEPVTFLRTLGDRKAVGLNCVPSLWRSLLDLSYFAEFPTESLTGLFVGGEELNSDLVMKSVAKLQHLQIWNLYGPSETTANACAARITSAEQVSIGRPIANVQIYLLDRHQHPVPVGVPGELYIGGHCLARGYNQRAELTAESFVPHPFSPEPGKRLYRTGDLARYLPDGNIEFLGRVDRQVKIRGFRIELGEIEAMLCHHPEVGEAVVAARENGPGEKRLVAYVVPEQGRAATVKELRSFLQQKLPDYMIPSTFVFLDVLPLTPSGKVDRQALPEPDDSRPELIEGYVAPSTRIEEALAEMWAQLLGVEKVGIHDNFFDLGGHSLLAMQLFSRVRGFFQVELPVRCLFEAPTIAALEMVVLNSLVEQIEPKETTQILDALSDS